MRDTDFYGLCKKEYIALADEPVGALNEAEIALLDEVIEFVCDKNSAKTISEYSHKLPCEMAEFGEEIPYSTALLLFPVEVTPEAFDATEEGLAEVAEAGFSADPLAFPVYADFRSRVLSQIGQG